MPNVLGARCRLFEKMANLVEELILPSREAICGSSKSSISMRGKIKTRRRFNLKKTRATRPPLTPRFSARSRLRDWFHLHREQRREAHARTAKLDVEIFPQLAYFEVTTAASKTHRKSSNRSSFSLTHCPKSWCPPIGRSKTSKKQFTVDVFELIINGANCAGLQRSLKRSPSCNVKAWARAGPAKKRKKNRRGISDSPSQHGWPNPPGGFGMGSIASPCCFEPRCGVAIADGPSLVSTCSDPKK